MNCSLNEDDVGELISLKHKIKSVLEHPKSDVVDYYTCIKEMQNINIKFTEEGKSIPESDEYCVFDDMKTLFERFFDFLEEELEKKGNS